MLPRDAMLARNIALTLVLFVLACGGRAERADEAAPAEERVGPCGETATYTPTPHEGDACTQNGLVCGPYRCEGTAFRRIERCLTDPSQVGSPCKLAPGYQCTLRDHCNSIEEGSPYRGYECVDGKWADITSTPCPDAGVDASIADALID